MIRIEFTGAYEKMLRGTLQKNVSLKSGVDVSIKQFCRNPKDTRLRTHALKKRMKGKYAFSVTEDIRIIFIWKGKSSVRFLAIGSHTEAYGK